jgi:hypothetical protein
VAQLLGNRENRSDGSGPVSADVVPRGRLERRKLALLLVAAAAWGIAIDANVLPILAPTGNSTAAQATTATGFALIGILFGPLAGALGGLLRDGTSTILTIIIHPHLVQRGNFPQHLGTAVVDILEDMILGWIPGLIGLRTRRLPLLALASGVAAWISLPFLIVTDTLIRGRPDRVWKALTTITGNWDQPVDPGLTVYALFTACFVALALAWRHGLSRRSLAIVIACGAAALALVVLGANP